MLIGKSIAQDSMENTKYKSLSGLKTISVFSKIKMYFQFTYPVDTNKLNCCVEFYHENLLNVETRIKFLLFRCGINFNGKKNYSNQRFLIISQF